MQKSTRRRDVPRAAIEKLSVLSRLLAAHDRQCWEIGDLIVALVDSHRVRLGVVAAKVGYSKARLSELSVTARRFPPDERAGTFQDCLMAHRISSRFSGLDLSLGEIRDQITQMNGKRPNAIKTYFMNLRFMKYVLMAF